MNAICAVQWPACRQSISNIAYLYISNLIVVRRESIQLLHKPNIYYQYPKNRESAYIEENAFGTYREVN